jgi:predicted RNA polymerase sigma factor
MTAPAIEDLLRELVPQVLGTLIRRHGRFEGCEDAVQEAVLAATVQWPAEGVPDSPRGWLVTVASRRLIDQMRRDHARRERESAMATEVVPQDVLASWYEQQGPAVGVSPVPGPELASALEGGPGR